MVFVTHDETQAITRASYLPGRDTGTSKAKMEVDLQRVGDATQQAITNAAWEIFVAQLTAAGREIVSLEQVKPSYADFKIAPSVPQKINRGLL